MPSWKQSPWLWRVGLIVFAWLFIVSHPFRILGALVLVGGVIGVVALRPFIRRRRALEDLAERTGGLLVEEPFWADDVVSMGGVDATEWRPWMLLTCGLRESWIEYEAGSTTIILDVLTPGSQATRRQGDAWLTRLQASVPRQAHFGFELCRHDIAPTLDDGMKLAAIADPALRVAFNLATSDPSRANDLLNDLALATLIRSVEPARLGFSRDHDGRSTLWLYDEGPLPVPVRFQLTHNLFLALLERLSPSQISEHPRLASAKVPAREAAAPAIAEPQPSPPPVPVVEQPMPASLKPPPADPSVAELKPPSPDPSVVEVKLPPSPPALVEPASGGPNLELQPEVVAREAEPALVVIGESLPRMGEAARDESWEVTVSRFGPYQEIVGQPAPSTSGTFMVAEFVIANRQQRTGTLTTTNVSLEAGNGRVFQPAGQTTSVPKGFWMTWLQPGQSAEQRVVFELDAEPTDAVLTIHGLRFRLSP